MNRRIQGLTICLVSPILIMAGLWLFPARVIRATSQSSQTLRVPDEYPTIQDAIDASSSGDTIVVAAGTYEENINYLTKNITLTSETGPETTIIDGGSIDSVVKIGPAGKLIGFKIRNGYGSGGGVSVGGNGSVLLGNIFENNQQVSYGAAIGGNNASPVIEGNVFINNGCDSQYLSGVVSFINGSSPQIYNNIFKNNPCRAVNFTIPAGAAPQVFNNTIVNNTVGIRVDARIDTETQIYRNNIIFGNEVGLEVDFGSPPDYPTWEHNLVFGNQVDYDGIPDQTGIDGNISADPLFEDPKEENYELAEDSPAIDSGTNASCPIADIRGLPRPQGNACDIGAFETVLSAQKVVAGLLMPGEIVTYTISVINLMDSELTNIAITDVVPASLDYIPGSFTSNFGVGGEDSGVINWSGTIPTDTVLHIGFAALIDPAISYMTTITNVVDIEWQGVVIIRKSVATVEPFRAYLPSIRKACPPLFYDNFGNPSSGWPEVDDADYLLEYKNGEYRILVHPAFDGVIARNPNSKASDYTAEVDVRNLNEITGSYGIAFGIAENWSTFYSLEIYDWGWFGIYRWSPGGIVTLAEGFSPSILQGSATNHIRIERNGSTIEAYANGELLASLTDSQYLGNRYIGLIALSYDQQNLDVRFDNFAVYPAGCSGNISASDPAEGWGIYSDSSYHIVDFPDKDRPMPEK